MQIDEQTFAKMPSHLQALFAKAPNPSKDEVVGAFPNTSSGKVNPNLKRHAGGGTIYSHCDGGQPKVSHGDSGSAARFFYSAKASKKDRDEGLDSFQEKRTGGMQATADGSMLTGSGNERTTTRKNTHPTVKPTSLMQWLCRLITPPGGTVLDPFMGSGSTGKAAVYEGFKFIGCEREDEYIKIAEARIAYAVNTPPVAAAVAAQQPANDNEPHPQQVDLFGKAA